MGMFSKLLRKGFSRDSEPTGRRSSSLFGRCSSSLTGRESYLRRKLSTFRRKISTVAPTSSLVVVPGPSFARGSPIRNDQPPEPSMASPRPSFGFLSRRFFARNRSATALSTRPPTTAPPPTPPVLLLSHNNSESNAQFGTVAHYRPQQPHYQYNPGQRDNNSNNGQPSSFSLLSSSSPSTPPPQTPPPPKGINTNTGTISKLSGANCTRGFKSSITVRVISIRGGYIDVTFPIAKTGRELKLEAVGRFAVDATSDLPPTSTATNLQSSLAKYKLVTMNRRDVIDEELSLDRLGLRDRDQLLLVVKRSPDEGDSSENTLTTGSTSSSDKRKAAAEEEELQQLRGPSMKEIQRATEHLPPTEQTPPKVNIDDMVLQTDLQYDIRKILISLAQSSAYVIGAGPYADRLIMMLKQRLINKRKAETDSLNCLVDMGFARARAVFALKTKAFVYADALRWLIENPRQEVPSEEEMETRELFEAIQPEEEEGQSVVMEDGKGEEEGDDGAEAQEKRVLDAGLGSFQSRQKYIETLLEIIRIHAQREMPVCDEMVAKLLEMGFEEGDVREALKITQNNQGAACEWLIGGRSKSLTELRDGLPKDSPILRALMASPQVQISLGNPKMLLAYLSMLENYSSMNMWLSDTDTSGVLGHILRTYHEEKHIVAINQFSIVL